jgi:uncharacterized protein (DUF697 family)
MSRLALFNQLIAIVRELRVDEVRRDAELRPVLLIVGPDRTTAADLGDKLVGWAEDRAIVTRTFDESFGDLNRFDLIVAYDPDEVGRVATLRTRAERTGTLAALVRHDAATLDDDVALAATRRRIVELLPDRAVAFGRAYPLFRPVAINAVVSTTARANAQFALIANLPSVVPIIGSMFSVGADLLILTKNQVLLLFKVAAIHGRDLHDTTGILREMLPVVGSGLLWRTLAREAVSFLPLLAGTIPKVAIAYAGTFAVGRAADYYYRFGHGPTKAQRREFYQQGHEHLQSESADLVSKAANKVVETAKDTAAKASAGGSSIAEETSPGAGQTPPSTPDTDGTRNADGFTDETSAASTEGAQHAAPGEKTDQRD